MIGKRSSPETAAKRHKRRLAEKVYAQQFAYNNAKVAYQAAKTQLGKAKRALAEAKAKAKATPRELSIAEVDALTPPYGALATIEHGP